jgi:hypothetical protein
MGRSWPHTGSPTPPRLSVRTRAESRAELMHLPPQPRGWNRDALPGESVDIHGDVKQ